MFHLYFPRFTEAAFRASAVSATTAVAASVTIAHRMMLMSDPSGWTATTHREAVRMVSEKLDAMTEGTLEAAAEAGRLALRTATGTLTSDDMAHGLLAIGVAATKPAVRAARANATRLSRR